MAFTDEDLDHAKKLCESGGYYYPNADKLKSLIARLEDAEKALNLFNESMCCGNVLGDTIDLNDLLDEWRKSAGR